LFTEIYKFALRKLKYITGNILLLPFSWLYGLITGCRNFLYNKGIFKSIDFDIPVICVGNIAAGGTGKTPFSAFLIEKLSKEYKIALLSRGYRRKSKGFLLATDDSTAADIGDEPREIKTKFPKITVAVDADRVEGIQKIRQLLPDTQLVILDDGYQHRKVNPGLKILLTDYNRLFTRDHVLPYGMLRESNGGYKRADMVVVTKCPDGTGEEELLKISQELKIFPHQSLFFAGWEYATIYNLFSGDTLPSDALQEKEVVLMTGIAFPEPAVRYLKTRATKVELLQFPDHHFFTQKDYDVLAKIVGDAVKIIVVTEKDAARIVSDLLFPEQLKKQTYVLPVKMKVLQNKENALITKIIDYVRTNQTNS
jgi:tetraacyldisaccharide 4'-kinase